MGSKSVFLDVDTSIRDKNLLITKPTEEEEEFSKFLKSSNIGQLPPIRVKPTPGFCVKSREKSGKKVFLNFCQTDKVPAPKDITESQLGELLAADDPNDVCEFRVPMSIGAMRTDTDKKGEEVNVCDIAINTNFMQKCNEKEPFKHFLIAVAFEGYQNKFDVSVIDERIILRNKKVMGELQDHHIQQREVEQKLGLTGEKLPKLDEIMQHKTPEAKTGMTSKIQVLDEVANTPKYRMFFKPDDSTTLHGEFYLPYVVAASDISLDIGEDRVVLETTNGKYFLDTFHDYHVDNSLVKSEYNRASKFLTVAMPLKSSA